MNAYDNTIRYTDGFLASLITLLQKTKLFFGYALYFGSWRGYFLMIIEKLFLHASPGPVLLSTACAIFNLVVQNI